MTLSEYSTTTKYQVSHIVTSKKEMLGYGQNKSSDDAHTHTGKFKSVGHFTEPKNLD